ncbi:MAG: prolipoprotein diacylglyceryl transferase family protein [Candidatus Brocadiia bacterium]
MSPRLFDTYIFGIHIEIFYYGVLILIGYLAAFALCSRLAKRYGIRPGEIFDAGFLAIISGFAGAKVSFLLSHPDYLRFLIAHPSLDFIFGGFDFLGGLVVGSVTVYFYLRHKKYHPFAFGDILAPGFALAHAFGRLGCFMNGCCYGFRTDDFGMCFVPESAAYIDQAAAGDIGKDALYSLPVFPTQLLEACLLFLLAAFLTRAVIHRKFAGQAFSLYLIAYGIIRFGTQFTRDDEAISLGPLKIWHIIALAVLLTGVLLYRYFRRKAAPPDAIRVDSPSVQS